MLYPYFYTFPNKIISGQNPLPPSQAIVGACTIFCRKDYSLLCRRMVQLIAPLQSGNSSSRKLIVWVYLRKKILLINTSNGWIMEIQWSKTKGTNDDSYLNLASQGQGNRLSNERWVIFLWVSRQVTGCQNITEATRNKSKNDQSQTKITLTMMQRTKFISAGHGNNSSVSQQSVSHIHIQR